MKIKIYVTLGFIIILLGNCSAEEKDKAESEPIITRYVSVLNAIATADNIPEDEVKREVLLSLMINYFYYKNHDEKISKKFKGITKSIGGKLEGFDFKLELKKYTEIIKSADEKSALFRLSLDGFDEKVAKIILEKSKSDDFDDLTNWISE
ncbi:MAG: hypothetical protein V4727_08100 [Verrucomicrobiota bacterium]